MSAQKANETRLLIDSIEDETGMHCVDVIRGDDGQFFLKVYRREPEEGGKWMLVADYSSTRYQEKNQAVDAAAGLVPWVRSRA
jgi:N12 class adenine-specific DNA methylase